MATWAQKSNVYAKSAEKKPSANESALTGGGPTAIQVTVPAISRLPKKPRSAFPMYFAYRNQGYL